MTSAQLNKRTNHFLDTFRVFQKKAPIDLKSRPRPWCVFVMGDAENAFQMLGRMVKIDKLRPYRQGHTQIATVVFRTGRQLHQPQGRPLMQHLR